MIQASIHGPGGKGYFDCFCWSDGTNRFKSELISKFNRKDSGLEQAMYSQKGEEMAYEIVCFRLESAFHRCI